MEIICIMDNNIVLFNTMFCTILVYFCYISLYFKLERAKYLKENAYMEL